jgi:hypothetical protein
MLDGLVLICAHSWSKKGGSDDGDEGSGTGIESSNNEGLETGIESNNKYNRHMEMGSEKWKRIRAIEA